MTTVEVEWPEISAVARDGKAEGGLVVWGVRVSDDNLEFIFDGGGTELFDGVNSGWGVEF